jgi:hypothetical protein
MIALFLMAALVQATPPDVQASPLPVPVPQSTTTPIPRPVTSPAPISSGAATPATSASASGAPSQAPGPSPTPVYNFVYKSTPSPGSTPFPELNAPEILEIDVTDQTIAAPGPLHVRILTSDSVVSVVASSFGYEFSIPKMGIGVFRFDGVIPVVPDTVKNKRFDVDVTATSKNGRILRLTLPFMLK